MCNICHGAELIKDEFPLIPAHAALREQYGPRRTDPDKKRTDQHEWAQENQCAHCYDEVEATAHPGIDPWAS